MEYFCQCWSPIIVHGQSRVRANSAEEAATRFRNLLIEDVRRMTTTNIVVCEAPPPTPAILELLRKCQNTPAQGPRQEDR